MYLTEAIEQDTVFPHHRSKTEHTPPEPVLYYLTINNESPLFLGGKVRAYQ
jgi:hypothetical protein